MRFSRAYVARPRGDRHVRTAPVKNASSPGRRTNTNINNSVGIPNIHYYIYYRYYCFAPNSKKTRFIAVLPHAITQIY